HEEEIQLIIRHLIRILHVKFGWIKDFDKIIVNYVTFFCFYSNVCFYHSQSLLTQITTFIMFEKFVSSRKLFNTFTGHNGYVWSIDYSIFDDNQFICSGSHDNTVCVWNTDTNEKIQSFNGHSGYVYCVKFSPYHYHNNHQNIICSSSFDKIIRFWDFKHNRQLQIFNGHTNGVGGIEFSPFNGGQYLCSGSFDKTVDLCDIELSKLLHIFSGHKRGVWCVCVSPLQSNTNSNKSNNISVIGGNGYTICSGSLDKRICI
ncbi:WD-repeat protein, partial [Reticulomyxa filosa]